MNNKNSPKPISILNLPRLILPPQGFNYSGIDNYDCKTWFKHSISLTRLTGFSSR